MSRTSNIYDGETEMRFIFSTVAPLPGQTDWWAVCQVTGNFRESQARQVVRGFPDERSARQAALVLVSDLMHSITEHPWFERATTTNRQIPVAEYKLGDLKASAAIHWMGDNGWGWLIEIDWPEDDIRIVNQTNYLNVLLAYADLRQEFLAQVHQIGGNAYEIETLDSPFLPGQPIPVLASSGSVLPTVADLEALRDQVALELAEHQKHVAENPAAYETKETDDDLGF